MPHVLTVQVLYNFEQILPMWKPIHPHKEEVDYF